MAIVLSGRPLGCGNFDEVDMLQRHLATYGRIPPRAEVQAWIRKPDTIPQSVMDDVAGRAHVDGKRMLHAKVIALGVAWALVFATIVRWAAGTL